MGEATLWPWAVILVGAGATYVWRGLGVAISHRVGASGPVFEWFACVAFALLAGLISRMILMPSGGLADTPLDARLGSAAIAVVVFYLFRKSILAGLLAGIGTMIAWIW